MIFGPDEMSDAIAGLRALGGSLPNEIDAAICRLAAEVLDHLRAAPCPYVRISDEGTAYCSLAEGTA